MALVMCPDCEKMISPRVEACPFCGCPKKFFNDEGKNNANRENERKDDGVEQSNISNQDLCENVPRSEIAENSNRKANITEVEEAVQKMETIINHYLEMNPDMIRDNVICNFIKNHTGIQIDIVDDENRYDILGDIIEIPVDVQNERYIGRNLDPVIDQVGNAFCKWYDSKSDCIEVYQGFEGMVVEVIFPVIKKCTEILNQQEVYSIDENIFLEKYCRGFAKEYLVLSDEMIEQIGEIESQKQQKKEYRDLRKATRGRVVGGGFGLGGALKGMATAGTMNAMTGLAHSLGNAIGNAGSSMASASNKASVYKRSKGPLKDAIVGAAYEIKRGFREALKEEAGIICKYVTSVERNQSDAILMNCMQGRIPDEKIKEQLEEALLLNPYNVEIYEMIWLLYGDRNGELMRLASYFGKSFEAYIRSTVEEYGKKIYAQKCQEYLMAFNKMATAVSIENKIKAALDKMISFCEDHSVQDEMMPEISSCRELLEIIDIKLRTVKDKLYDTRELAEKIRMDYQQFYNLLAGKKIGEKDVELSVLGFDFITEEFKAEVPILYTKECELREPRNLFLNVRDKVDSYKNKGVLDIIHIDILECQEDGSEIKENMKQITSMPDDEVPVIMFERSGNGKSAVLLTNRYVRIYSGAFFTKENRMFEIDKVELIECIAPGKFRLNYQGQEVGEFSLKVKRAKAECQINLGVMISELVELIKNLYSEDRKNLNVLFGSSKESDDLDFIAEGVSENIFCNYCGKQIRRTAKFCNYCGKQITYKGQVKVNEM